MAERFKLRHVHAITGTFVLVVVAMVVAIVAFAAHSQRWFMGNVSLDVVMPAAGAAGIRQGSEVYFLGTLVGSVSDIRVESTGRMTARVAIRRDFYRFVRTDSWAVVHKKFGVGDAYFEILRGGGPPLPEVDATIVCNPPVPSELEAAVEDIRREALPMLKKFSAGVDTWSALGSNLIATRERLDKLILRADDIASDLQEGNGTAGNLLTDPAIADELKSLLAEASRSMHELQATLNNLKDASRNFQAASSNLPAISIAVRNETRDLPGLVLQTQSSMRELERLIDAAQKTWPWRRHVNKTNPPPLLQSSEPRKSSENSRKSGR